MPSPASFAACALLSSAASPSPAGTGVPLETLAHATVEDAAGEGARVVAAGAGVALCAVAVRSGTEPVVVEPTGGSSSSAALVTAAGGLVVAAAAAAVPCTSVAVGS